jgi:predicted transposase/invertase (TIGR01784 family)
MTETLIRFDWAIKRLLRNKANFVILEGFLSELLKEDIAIVEILESESNMQDAGNKLTRVDLLVKNSKDELVIIEVLHCFSSAYLLNVLNGVSKLIKEISRKEKDNLHIKKIVSVNIIYFNFEHGEDYFYSGVTNFEGIYKKDKLSLTKHEETIFKPEQIDNFKPEFYYINIDGFDNVMRNPLDEWVNFFKTDKVNEGSTAKGLAKAKETIENLMLDKSAMNEYYRAIESWRDYSSDMSTHFLSGKLEGLEKGKQEGILEGKLEIAKNCLAIGMGLNQISEITGLSNDILVKYLKI